MPADDESRLIATPSGFIFRVLLQGAKMLGDWQAKFVDKFVDPTQLVRAALVTPNGSGKSSIIVAGLALWWISIFRMGKVVIISYDSKQLDHQCWPSIEAHRAKFENDKGWRFIEREVHTPDGAFIVGFTTDDPGRAEGWHKIDDTDGPLLMLYDEAKSQQEGVFDAGDRCTYNAQAYISSPGLNQGRFYDAFTTLKKAPENPHGFDTMQVSLTDCPWIPKSRIDATIATHGIDNPFTRSTLFGEFMDADADTMFVFPRSATKAAMDANPLYVHGGRAAFCDFAAGRNENVFAFKEGNRVKIVAWRDMNTMSAIGRFMLLFREHNLQPSETYGDAGGMGKVFIDRFHELGWPIIPVRNDDDPTNPMYENRGAEDWHEASHKTQLQNIIMPDDPILYKQLTSRRIKFTGTDNGGLLGIESKKDMSKRGLESPDRADAYVGVVNVDTSMASALLDEFGLRFLESAARAGNPERGALTMVGTDVSWEVGAEKSWLNVWERPIVGRSYICVVNPVPHEDMFGHHVVMMLRAPFADEDGKKTPARLVAKMQYPCRLEAGPLVDAVKTLSKWYGNPFVVPVVNDRGDVMDKLLSAGLAVYARENFESYRQGGTRGQQVVKFGWESNDYTRSMWIGALAEVVRQRAIEVQDLSTVMQMFQVKGSNAHEKREAEAVGVAVKEMGRATKYIARVQGVSPVGRKERNLAKAQYS